ncbi:MAG: response regulator [Alphaproteobacteria bacterium]
MSKPIAVLFIDDDPIVGKLVIDFLQSENIDAHHAVSIGEALKIIRKPKPDVILLDWYLGDETAVGFIDHIAHWGEKWQGIPIIWVTAKALVGDREACLNIGGVDYLSKPFSLDKLLELINKYGN